MFQNKYTYTKIDIVFFFIIIISTSLKNVMHTVKGVDSWPGGKGISNRKFLFVFFLTFTINPVGGGGDSSRSFFPMLLTH